MKECSQNFRLRIWWMVIITWVAAYGLEVDCVGYLEVFLSNVMFAWTIGFYYNLHVAWFGLFCLTILHCCIYLASARCRNRSSLLVRGYYFKIVNSSWVLVLFDGLLRNMYQFILTLYPYCAFRFKACIRMPQHWGKLAFGGRLHE